MYALRWLDGQQSLALCALMLAAIVASLPGFQPHPRADWRMLRPSFVIEFAALLLFALPMLLVAAFGALTRFFCTRDDPQPAWRTALQTTMATLFPYTTPSDLAAPVRLPRKASRTGAARSEGVV